MKQKLKKLVVCFAITLSINGNAYGKVVSAPKGYYPHMGVVTKVKRVKHVYKVTCRDANGHKWSWYDDAPDWYKGDFAALLMYDNGTPRKAKDDKVVDARYVGVKRMF